MAEVSQRWRRYFVQGLETDLTTIAEEFPARQSVYVDLVALHEFDSDLTRAIFDTPDEVLDTGAAVLNDLTALSGDLSLRVENNPHHCEVSELDANHLYDLVTVEGRVDSVGSVQAALEASVYECPGCETTTETSVRGIEPAEPPYCESCGWTGSFSLVAPESSFVDLRAVDIAPLERENGHEQREPLRAYLRGDIVDEVAPDARCYLTGILRATRTDGLNAFDPYLSVLSLREERSDAAPTSFTETIDARFDR